MHRLHTTSNRPKCQMNTATQITPLLQPPRAGVNSIRNTSRAPRLIRPALCLARALFLATHSDSPPPTPGCPNAVTSPPTWRQGVKWAVEECRKLRWRIGVSPAERLRPAYGANAPVWPTTSAPGLAVVRSPRCLCPPEAADVEAQPWLGRVSRMQEDAASLPTVLRLGGGKTPAITATSRCARPSVWPRPRRLWSRRFSSRLLLRSGGAARPHRDPVPPILAPHGIAGWQLPLVSC